MDNVLVSKVEAFSDRIVRMSQYLKDKRANAKMIDQVTRAGTSIGANIFEGVYAQSRMDFISKYSIALKEASETAYWLRKLRVAQSLSEREFNSIYADSEEIIKLLTSIINKAKKNIGKE